MCSNYPGIKWNQRFRDKKTKLKLCNHMLTSSSQLQNRSFHVVPRTKTSAECPKIKNARAMRANLLFFTVKYANLWRSCCRCCRGCVNSLLFQYPSLIMPRFLLKFNQTTSCNEGLGFSNSVILILNLLMFRGRFKKKNTWVQKKIQLSGGQKALLVYAENENRKFCYLLLKKSCKGEKRWGGHVTAASLLSS